MEARALGHFVGVGAIVVSALASGCAHQGATTPPEAPIAQTTSATASVRPAKSDVVLSDDLMKACNVDMNNEQTAPKFNFDQSAIREGDRVVLDQVAKCVTTGPLKGHALHLVGRADPRGEQEYNMVLGSSRATSVGSYLRSLGVPSTQISETSRGKLDATGTDDSGWALDRRVDID